MPIAPLPTPLQYLGARRFSFYPPIRNIEHNEWVHRRSSWSESVVVNMRTAEEVCIPRMFIGEVSSVDDPVIIVGLTRELEWKTGAVVPHQRRVIELPVAVNEGRTVPARHARPAQVVNIRLEPKSDVPARKWIGLFFALGAVAFTIMASVSRQSQTHPRLFSPGDDYQSVVSVLGKPASDRTVANAGRTFRLLTYTDRHFSVVMADGHYAATLDLHGRVLQGVPGQLPAF